MLLLAAAGTQAGTIATYAQDLGTAPPQVSQDGASPTATPVSIPTVTVPQAPSGAIPTVTLPQATAIPTPKPRSKHRRKAAVRNKAPRTAAKPATGEWITAFLTSYCPGSAGWLSSSGRIVHYGMLANNYYRFGTRVYIPVLGITGVVEDHLAGFPAWNHFDVWSPSCYSTPTGYFQVAVQA